MISVPRSLWILAFSGSLAVALAGCSGDSGELTFTQAQVTKGDIESIVVTTGTLEALNTVVVGSQLSGQIQELNVDFNDVVTAQQLIARIDPRTFEARVLQNQADVSVAKANIVQREAELTRWEATLAQAERELARKQGLQEQGHVSASELDQEMTNVETSNAQLKMTAASIANAQAVLIQRGAALHQSELDLERTYIRSPVAGTVINRTVEVGQTVAASFSAPELFQIAQDLHEMKVEASVDEADIGRISEGQNCRFTVDAYPERDFTGRVQQIRKAPDIVQNVVTYRVIITAANNDLALLPGMTANVEIVLGRKQNVLRVPNAALRFVPRGMQATAGQAASFEGGQTAGAGAEGGRRGGPGMMDELLDQLDLTSDQRTAITELMTAQRERFQQMARSSGGGGAGAGGRGGGDRGAMGERFRQARQNMNASIRELLTAEQGRRFLELSDNRRSRGQRTDRPGTVWIMAGDEPELQRVRIGLADDQFTELVGGLDEGDSVIVRASRLAP